MSKLILPNFCRSKIADVDQHSNANALEHFNFLPKNSINYKDQHYSKTKQGLKLNALQVGGLKARLILLVVNFAALALVFEHSVLHRSYLRGDLIIIKGHVISTK